MRDALDLLSHLSDDDISWLFANSVQRSLAPAEVLIHEGRDPGALFIVLSGLLSVHVKLLGAEPLDHSGPGELLGEMSFLEGKPAAATLRAEEPSEVLALERERLRARLDAEPRFAAELYGAFARVLSARHRQQLAGSERLGAPAGDDSLEHLWQPCAEAITAFKQLIRDADIEALGDRDEQAISEPTRAAIIAQFRRMSQTLTDGVSNRADLQPALRDQLGGRIKRELLPFLLLTETTERFYSKPRGYAGDFVTIDNVYNERVSGSGRLGELIDACVVVHEPASQAVRNRRRLLADEIVRGAEALDQARPYRVTVLAAGPASEVFDAFERLGDPARLEVTLIDIDPLAIEMVHERIATRERAQPGLGAQLRTEHANLIYLVTGRQKLDLADQDFVYSMGLIDYLERRYVIALLDYIHGLLRPGGRVMLGNFHPETGTRALMDYVFDWKLIFRTEADMRALYEASRFASCSRIVFEDAGVDMFAEAIAG